MGSQTFCISLIFGLIAFLTVFTFYKAFSNAKGFGMWAVLWFVVQICVSLSVFYVVIDTLLIRFALIFVPSLLPISWLFISKSGKGYLDQMNLHLLTVIHVVRAPVEVVLYFMFICRLVPCEMTFGGGNLDIISGLSAPIVYYVAVMQGKTRWQLLLGWNVVCLGLLINMVSKSVLSAPFFFHQIAFDQPNVAFMHFPFVFLPGTIVPILLCSHLAMIRNLVKEYWYQHRADSRSIAHSFLAERT